MRLNKVTFIYSRVCTKCVCAKARQGETRGQSVLECMSIPGPVSTKYGRVQIHVQNQGKSCLGKPCGKATRLNDLLVEK